MATFGDVFGLGFALEGISFFVEAIFIAIYVYGWDRLSPRRHFLRRHPDRGRGLHRLAHRDRGQRLDEPPDRLHGSWTAGSPTCIRGRRCSATRLWHELVHMYLAGYIVAGFMRRRRVRLGRLRGRRGRYDRTALRSRSTVAALAAPAQVVVGDWAARDVASDQPVKLAAFEGLGTTTSGRAGAPPRLVRRTARCGTASRSRDLLSLLAYHDPNATVQGLDAVPAGRAAAGQRRPLRVPDDGRHRHGCSRCSPSSTCGVRLRRGRLPESPWFYRALVARRARCRSSR